MAGALTGMAGDDRRGVRRIFYNAMLPSLVGSERLGRWSGWAWGLGYAGGLASLVVALFAFVRAEHPWFSLDRTAAEHVRATFLLVAVWYLLFAMPLFLCTPEALVRARD